MNEELQEKLYQKYPKIFRQKDMTAQETAMCWGIATGDGWYDLIDNLCGEIQNRVENVNRNRSYKIENSPKTLVPFNAEEFVCEAVQVKEKFGTLCFYTQGGDDYIDGLISMAESISSRTCTECGQKSKPQKNRGWIYTLCDNCKQKKEMTNEN